jgi:hypothetical protein
MTLRELGKVFPGKVQVTVLGYYSNGEYYSFYTAIPPYETEYISKLVKEESYLIDMPIKRLATGYDGRSLCVDVIEDLGDKLPEEES